MPSPREEQLEFHDALAQAVIQWSMVEASLLEAFTRFIASTNANAVSAAFHAVINFNAKLEMINGAAAYTLTEEQFQQGDVAPRD